MAQLLFESQRKRGQEGFGRGIGAGKGDGLKAGSRGDVDDAFLLSLQHSRKKVVGELNDGFVVEAEHLQLPEKGKIAEFSAETKAGIVDEQVDLNAALRELLGEVLAGSGGSQIRRKSDHGDRMGAAQLRREGLARFGGTGAANRIVLARGGRA